MVVLPRCARPSPPHAFVVRHLTDGDFGCAVTPMIPSLHIVARRIFPNIGRCSSPIRPLFLATAAGWTGVFFGLTASEPPARWQPARDDVYLEEVGRKVATAEPLVAVGFFEGNAYAGSNRGL